VRHLVGILREVKRVLRDDGTLWLVLGDTYVGGGNNRSAGSRISVKQATNKGATGQMAGQAASAYRGLPAKNLAGIPWRVAFALQDDGWYLRSDIIWAKKNPMPESVTDRPTRSHEHVFLLSKRPRYYYDADAIREPHTDESLARYLRGSSYNGDKPYAMKGGPRGHGVQKWEPEEARGWAPTWVKGHSGYIHASGRLMVNEAGRNKRDVWFLATQPVPDAHFATFPEKLVEPCMLAGSRAGDTVLDPFAGSGTVGVVALRWGRQAILIEANPEYCAIARKRIASQTPALLP